MSRTLAIISVYFGTALLSVALLDAADDSGSLQAAFFAVTPLLLASFACGWFSRSWWSVVLALMPVVVAVPFGYADGIGEDTLLWIMQATYIPAYAAVISCGVLLGKRSVRQRPSST